MKKKVGFLIVLTLLLATSMSGAKVKEFKDVPENAWYTESLGYILEDGRGIISGFPDGTFRPEETLTVEQFIKCIIEAAEIEVTPFSNGTWSAPYINKAKEKGYIQSGELVDIMKPITRGEMARVVIRAIRDITGDVTYRDSSEITNFIKDYNTIKTELKDFVVKCYDIGIIVGYPDNTFRADNSLTRAEALEVIRRLIDVSARKAPVIAELIEGISFDPARDVTERGAMALDKQEEFVIKFFESIRLYEENGEAYIRGYLPEVPEGFVWFAKIVIRYNDGKQETFYSQKKVLNKDLWFYQGENFRFKLRNSKSKFEGIGISVWIENNLGIEDGRFFINSEDEYYIKYDKFQENTFPFKWGEMFGW